MVSMNTKRIRESIKQRLNESWPAILNGLSAQSKDKIRHALSTYYIDIENTPSDAIQVTSSRDPRLKSGMTIFDFGETGRGYNKHPIAVFVNGKAIVDPVVPGTAKSGYSYDDIPASKLSWNSCILNAKTIYHMSFDDMESRAANKELRQQRATSKKGTVNRYRDKEVQGLYGPSTIRSNEFGNTPGRYDKLDKSGYVINPSKYIDMLADAGVKNGEQILQDAREVYRQLAAIVPDHLEDEAGPGYWGDTNEYLETLQYLGRTFRDLRRQLDEYNKAKERWGEDNFSRGSVQRAIKDLRGYVQKAKELVTKG